MCFYLFHLYNVINSNNVIFYICTLSSKNFSPKKWGWSRGWWILEKGCFNDLITSLPSSVHRGEELHTSWPLLLTNDRMARPWILDSITFYVTSRILQFRRFQRFTSRFFTVSSTIIIRFDFEATSRGCRDATCFTTAIFEEMSSFTCCHASYFRLGDTLFFYIRTSKFRPRLGVLKIFCTSSLECSYVVLIFV